MTNESPAVPQNPDIEVWKQIVARYQQPSTPRAVWQIVNTLVPYGALWYLMYLSLAVSYWITLPLAILTAGFQVRIFIIFHDCGHGTASRASPGGAQRLSVCAKRLPGPPRN